MAKRIQSLFWSLALGLGGVVLQAQAAHAVQASGAILLIPSKQQLIQANEEITVQVYFRNTSTTSPNAAVPPLLNVAANPAILTGPISIDLSSTDCGGPANSTALDFIPGPAAGCDAKAANVTSCADGVAGEVLINLAPGGVSAPDDTPVFLATIRLKNTVQPPADLPRLNIRASTGTCSVTSCVTPIPPQDCVSCSAEGCTFVSGNVNVNLMSCKHGCPNKIEFFPQAPAKQDLVHINFLVQQIGYDPANQPFRLVVSKGAVVIFDTGLLPGIPAVGGNFILNGPGNNTTPGIEEIQVLPRTGVGAGGVDCTNGFFKVIVDGRGNFSAAAMVDPTITFEVTLGAQTYTNTAIWTSTSGSAGITRIQFDDPNRSPC